MIYTLTLGGAVVIAAALIGTSVLLTRDSGSATTTTEATSAAVGVEVDGVARINRLLAGIPQRGTVLGSSDAPVTLVEYADLQCPYCAVFATEAFPSIVRDYVRTGKVRVVFRGLSFVGPDSQTALETVLAAGAQKRLWHVVELLYSNQGGENSGWVSEELLRGVGEAVPGLRVETMLNGRSAPSVATQRSNAQASANLAGVRGTPSFAVGPTGGVLNLVSGSEAATIRAALDAALASAL